MKSKKKIIPKNYLEQIPLPVDSINWKKGSDGVVTLEVENKGWVNKIAQTFFNRPKVSFIHLDKLGSFIWPLLDGKLTITEIGTLVDKEFGQDAHPLYERLARYFQIMHSYHFITLKDSCKKDD